MADKLSSPEWLPAGWTSKVKTSKNGNKYKSYSDPSKKFKFLSKPEVLRYLNSIDSNLQHRSEDDSENFGHPKSLEKSKETIKHSEENVVVEEAIADGLPPGWIKEVRVTQRGKSVRRDLYYTDPISGYVFLSLKDCKRYIKTGILGKSSYMPKDKDHINMELENDNISSPVDQGNELQDGGISGGVTKNNEETLTATITNNHERLRGQNYDQCNSVVAGSGLNSQNIKSMEQREEDCDSILENGAEIHKADKIQRRVNKSNTKRSSDFPRRASKRLAGVELDPVPELKTNNRTRRLADRHFGEATTSSSCKICDLPAPEELPGKLEAEIMASEQLRPSTALPLANLANSEQSVGQGSRQISEQLPMEPLPIYKGHAPEKKPLPASREKAGDEESMMLSREEQGKKDELRLVLEEKATMDKCASNIDATLESPTSFSMADLWQDPCIEFAIKTLTGAIPLEEENKVEYNSGSSADVSLTDLWNDPCIEFAVKTLTGAIPLDEDLNIQNLFQQQISSPETRGDSGITLPNSDNFCQTDYMTQFCNAVEKPDSNKKQGSAASKLPQTSTGSLQNSGGPGIRQNIRGRSSIKHP